MPEEYPVAYYIPMNLLQKGGLYLCVGRCPMACYWNGERFEGLEDSTGALAHYDDYRHWDSDPKYGTVKPVLQVTELMLYETAAKVKPIMDEFDRRGL